MVQNSSSSIPIVHHKEEPFHPRERRANIVNVLCRCIPNCYRSRGRRQVDGFQTEIIPSRGGQTRQIASWLFLSALPSDECQRDWSEDTKPLIREEWGCASAFDRTRWRPSTRLRDTGTQRRLPSVWREDSLNQSRRPRAVVPYPRRPHAEPLFTRIETEILPPLPVISGVSTRFS